MKPCIAAIAVLLIAAAAFPAEPSLTFEPERLTAKGVTPGGEVIFFGAGLTWGDWVKQVSHYRAVVTDDDKDGAVSFDRTKGFANTSLVLAIDTAGAAFAVATPSGPPLSAARPLPSHRARYGPTGDLEELAETAQGLDVLLLRPGEGAWVASIRDGDRLDADQARDGSVAVAIRGLAPLGRTARTADSARPGDILVLIDTTTLQYSAARLTARPESTGGEP